MLFIEDYQKAKEYHNAVLKCWLHSKLYTTRERGIKCNLEKCPSCIKTRKVYINLSEELRDFIRSNIELILSGTINDLVQLFRENELLLRNNDENVKKLFNTATYENFFQKECGERFLNLLNKNTCLYCNRNYTLSLIKGRSRAQIDHWLPKNHFPLFAVSFYNLIPSCSTCNHLKGKGKDIDWWLRNFNMTYPYGEKGTFEFDYKFSSKNKLEIDFKNISSPNVHLMINQNRLKEIYSGHIEFELRELYDLRLKYPTDYLQEVLSKTFSSSISEEEKYRLIFGVEKEEVNYHKRPLSKFKGDIIKQLLSIK